MKTFNNWAELVMDPEWSQYLSDNHIPLDAVRFIWEEAIVSKKCAYVIAWYMNGYKQAPWFWAKDNGWCKLNSDDLWVGTYEDAVKLAEEIKEVSILTQDCAKEIVSHYEFL